MPPRTVGPWEILSLAGRGGVGTVYRARHRDSGARAAVKLLPPPPVADPMSARRLAREYEALAGLDHPNVVRVLEAGVHEGYSYLAMELVDGLDLRSYLSPAFDLPLASALRHAGYDPISTFSAEPDTEGLPPVTEHGPEALRAFAERLSEPDTVDVPAPPPEPPRGPRLPVLREEPRPPTPAVLALLNAPPRVARLRDALRQVCSGLSYVHAHGLVHRDLKPSNVMVDDARRVRLMDFGLVKLAHEGPGGLALHGRVVGTYRYMAPEQARGLAVDGRADLYSLGVILFELLCGRPPFLADRAGALWEEILTRPPPAVRALNPSADPRLGALAERLLQKSPAERPRDADEVAAAIA